MQLLLKSEIRLPYKIEYTDLFNRIDEKVLLSKDMLGQMLKSNPEMNEKSLHKELRSYYAKAKDNYIPEPKILD
jgi:hypothetical protein